MIDQPARGAEARILHLARDVEAHRTRPAARRTVRLACLLGCLLVALAWSGAPMRAAAQQPSVAWQRYDVDLAVQSDGSVQVTETQAIQFQGTYQQGFRLIPTDRVTAIDEVSVAELTGGQTLTYRPSPTPTTNAFRTSTTDQGLRVDWWFSPTTDTAARTFVLRYTVRGAIRIYASGDQLAWKAVYADRAGPVAQSTTTVHLPADVSPTDVRTSFSRYSVDQDGRPGALPSDGGGQQVDPRTIRFTLGALPANTGAEVRVQFPHGLVPATPPAWQADADRADWVQQTLAPIGGFVAVLLGLAILAGGGAVLFLVWYGRGRDPAPGAVPARLDQRPSDLPAPLAGTLVDEVADVQDAVATLVDLAQRQAVVLSDEDNPHLIGSTHDVRVALMAPVDQASARPYERLLLVGLFGSDAQPGAQVRLSEIGGRFAAVIPALQQALHRAVAQEGLFVDDPEAVRGHYQRLGWTLAGLGVVLAGLGAVSLGWAVGLAWFPGAALAVLGFVLTRIARAMPRRTSVGALEAARWRAFRAHLADVDAPAGTHRPEDLPYAVAFGIDRSFLRRLESIGTRPPAWYASGSGWGMPGGVIVLPGGGFGGGYRHGGGWPAPGGGSGQGGPGLPDPQSWSDGLADLLNGASDALASGGGSGDWSGGGFGGGGGGGGGSGGFQ